eukprot:360672-Chlamydomonas_euryale.AAC.14
MIPPVRPYTPHLRQHANTNPLASTRLAAACRSQRHTETATGGCTHRSPGGTRECTCTEASTCVNLVDPHAGAC